MLGDKWVVLFTIAVSRATHLYPSTAHRSRTRAYIFNINSRISVYVCALCRGNGRMYDRSLISVARGVGRVFSPGLDTAVDEAGDV